MLTQHTHGLTFPIRGRGLLDITDPIQSWVNEHGMHQGLLTLFIRHTSASLLIQENVFQHTAEGPDDMPAHIRAALTATQLSIPLIDGRLALGTWQGIYLYEHRTRGHRREVALHLLGQ